MAAKALVSRAVEQLGDLLHKQVNHEIDLLTGIEGKVRNLIGTLKRILDVLDDAEQRQRTKEVVRSWLQDLEDVSYEIADVVDEWNYTLLKREVEGTLNGNSIGKQRVWSFILSSFFKPAVVGNLEIKVKIKELNTKFNLIEKIWISFGFITSNGVASDSQSWGRIQTSSVDESEVFGRETDKNNLVTQLLRESRQEEKNGIRLLSIIGTGGIGKTTLAQLAYNDDQVKGCFDERVWAYVSDPFDEIRVAQDIVEAIEGNVTNPNELNLLLQRIRDITSGKRIFLVFDDVWTENDVTWELFKNSLKHSAPGSAILLTTRSEKVARVAGATCMISLGFLSDSESWSLFCQVAFHGRTEAECKRFENIGKEIVRKCDGLPLAIKCLSSVLRFKTTMEEWQAVRESNIWELEVLALQLYRSLYLSYNNLSFLIKRCFSYCALFPKDKVIKVDDLIRIWMAQGYLSSTRVEDEMEVEGRKFSEKLAIHSFFQEIEKDDFKERIASCKMEVSAHHFAQFLIKHECLTIEGERKEEYGKDPRHLSWIGSEEATITPSLLDLNIGQLHSFFAENVELETLITHLLCRLKRVRVLKLNRCSLKELPTEIKNWIHLRYLGLCDNDELKSLPDAVYNLYNLQTLNLEGCQKLQELPPGIEKLTKLRHLIPSVHDMKFPVGIGKLTCLQTLCNFSVGREYNKLEYLKNLNQLRGSLCIHIKDNLDDVTDAKNANLKSKKHLERLMFKFAPSVRVKKDVMEALEPPPNLETRLPKWMTSLNNLGHLSLSHCFRLTSLPALGMLPYLEKLEILNLPQLKFVDSVFLGLKELLSSPAAAVFPSLKELEFVNCEEWEEWEDIGHESIPIMPRLCRLTINGCRKLKSLPYRLLHKASLLKCIVLDEKEYDPSAILSTAGKVDFHSRSTEEATSSAATPRLLDASCWRWEMTRLFAEGSTSSTI